jgi:hypothetical protein
LWLDLHPGKGFPIGSANASEGIIYPHLVGTDIGMITTFLILFLHHLILIRERRKEMDGRKKRKIV